MSNKPIKRGPNVQIEEELYERIKDELLWSRQSVKSLVNNTLEWLLNQDEGVQGAIIGGLPSALRPEFAKLVLDRMASEPIEHEEEASSENMKFESVNPKRKAAKVKKKRLGTPKE